jgi:hypothetical protein
LKFLEALASLQALGLGYLFAVKTLELRDTSNDVLLVAFPMSAGVSCQVQV